MNAPEEYQPVIQNIPVEIHTKPQQKYRFIHLFVKTQKEVEKYAKLAVDSLDGDGHLWISYPKKSSKKYKCDISRDKGWDILGTMNFEPVTQISIDEDWSALRFRNVDYIKTMKRKFALSEKGKERIKNN